ncbi:MAG TPA: peptidylprolyl isomerase [Thermoanaerobaculia bacterium]|nr:peptidylprolyl isomerase [Thermoanaerobaculia bacterium]
MDRGSWSWAAAAALGAAIGCAAARDRLREPARPDPRAPERFVARFETSAGMFEVEVTRGWAPRGADRFFRLVRGGYYDGSKVFRVIPGYIAQFGIAGDPAVAKAWRFAYFPDDAQGRPCERGTVAFADQGPNTRATQVFVNLADNPKLDTGEFAPFGRVVSGMEAVDRLHGYGRAGPQGERTDQSALFEGGNRYLEAHYPALDTIRRATIVR